MRQELLAARSPDTCAHCPSVIPEGTHAWWDADERVWTCTICVPPDESASHSVGYSPVAALTAKRQRLAAASFVR